MTVESSEMLFLALHEERTLLIPFSRSEAKYFLEMLSSFPHSETRCLRLGFEL
jgi:hypothetical protein